MKSNVGILAVALTIQGASIANADHSLWRHNVGHVSGADATAPIQVKSKSGHCPPGLAK
ncbi:hypothetical protein RUM4293_01655 [Ruegeria atlantica]|uniref:Uncharacterized protein n=1 Tax=Ruegeria atlantica TaxID=81569 RepID=A0A0P1E3K3_9RHOB|nr:hypothetical protein RUM4293_01655 [Ruegeria atlantica]